MSLSELDPVTEPNSIKKLLSGAFCGVPDVGTSLITGAVAAVALELSMVSEFAM